MGRARRIALATALGVAATVYWFVVRPWHREWGATHTETEQRLPGDDLVPEPAEEATRAITVEAPPEAVWPWLARMGSESLLDTVGSSSGIGERGSDRSSGDQRVLEAGDAVPLVSEGLPVDSPAATPEVAVVDDERALVLHSSSGRPTYSWALVLEPEDDGTTRLLARTRARQPESPARLAGTRLLAEPIHFVVERRMLRGIKERAESDEEGWGQGEEDSSAEPELGPTI